MSQRKFSQRTPALKRSGNPAANSHSRPAAVLRFNRLSAAFRLIAVIRMLRGEVRFGQHRSYDRGEADRSLYHPDESCYTQTGTPDF